MKSFLRLLVFADRPLTGALTGLGIYFSIPVMLWVLLIHYQLFPLLSGQAVRDFLPPRGLILIIIFYSALLLWNFFRDRQKVLFAGTLWKHWIFLALPLAVIASYWYSCCLLKQTAYHPEPYLELGFLTLILLPFAFRTSHRTGVLAAAALGGRILFRDVPIPAALDFAYLPMVERAVEVIPFWLTLVCVCRIGGKPFPAGCGRMIGVFLGIWGVALLGILLLPCWLDYRYTSIRQEIGELYGKPLTAATLAAEYPADPAAEPFPQLPLPKLPEAIQRLKNRPRRLTIEEQKQLEEYLATQTLLLQKIEVFPYPERYAPQRNFSGPLLEDSVLDGNSFQCLAIFHELRLLLAICRNEREVFKKYWERQRRLAEYACHIPYLTGLGYFMNLENRTCRTFRHVMRYNVQFLSEKELRTYQTQLLQKADLAPRHFCDAVFQEAIVLDDVFEHMVHGSYSASAGSEAAYRASLRSLIGLSFPVYAQFRRDQIKVFSVFPPLLRLLPRPYLELKSLTRDIPMAAEELPPENVFIRMLPNLRRSMQALATTVALERMTAILVGAELYRREHGRLPETPEQLVPAFLPQFPVDPFTGKPFSVEYLPEQKAFLVHSPGPDGFFRIDINDPEELAATDSDDLFFKLNDPR